MIRLAPEELTPDMVLATDILTADGRILLRAGTRLQETYIARLESLGVPAVDILDEHESPPSETGVIDARTKAKALTELRAAFESVSSGNSIDVAAVNEVVDAILDQLLSNHACLVGMSDIRSADAYTYAHSVNVCILSLLMGIRLGFNRRDLQRLGVGALLHDIGKVYIPQEILKKPAPLSDEEMELVKEHPRRGFEHLRGYYDISFTSSQIAYQHHERLDGSGYPRQLRDGQIHRFARVVCVADVYDAATSDRIYRRGMQPHQVLDHLHREKGRLFDAEAVRALQQIIAPYPLGARVRLNTGEVALVIGVSSKAPDRPLVRVISAGAATQLSLPFDIDLRHDLDRVVVAIEQRWQTNASSEAGWQEHKERAVGGVGRR